MERIKKFNIFGTTYKVQWVDRLTDDNGYFLFGKQFSVDKVLKVNTKITDEKTPLPEDEVELSYYHELVHAILYEGGFHQENNEPLVEWFAKCLRSLKKQKAI